MLRTLFLLPVVAVALTASSIAFAGNPIAGCSVNTFAAPCAHDGTNPCSGLCEVDPALDGGISCMPPSEAYIGLSLYQMTVVPLDGLGCSPAGVPGSDCAHTCQGGQCVATNTPAGSECQPDGGANVCLGGCDGHGACVAYGPDAGLTSPEAGGILYGIARTGACAFIACDPFDSRDWGIEFYIPSGLSCDTGDPCMTAGTCASGNQIGDCIGTVIPNCVDPNEGDDAASDDADGDDAASPDDAGSDDAKDAGKAGDDSKDAGKPGEGTKDGGRSDAGHMSDGGSTSASSSGCSLGPEEGLAGAPWLMVVVPWLVSRRRRRSERP